MFFSEKIMISNTYSRVRKKHRATFINLLGFFPRAMSLLKGNTFTKFWIFLYFFPLDLYKKSNLGAEALHIQGATFIV